MRISQQGWTCGNLSKRLMGCACTVQSADLMAAAPRLLSDDCFSQLAAVKAAKTASWNTGKSIVGKSCFRYMVTQVPCMRPRRAPISDLSEKSGLYSRHVQKLPCELPVLRCTFNWVKADVVVDYRFQSKSSSCILTSRVSKSLCKRPVLCHFS